MIRRNRTVLPLDSRGREVRDDGLNLFDFVANDADIHHYAAGFIPPHWHEELEFFLLTSGHAAVNVGSLTFDILPGEGCFFNSGVLHSFHAVSDEPCLYRSYVFDASIVSGAPGSVFDIRYMRPFVKSGPAFFPFSEKNGHSACIQGFNAVFEACLSEDPGYEFTVRSGLSDMVMHIIKHSRLTPPRRPASAHDERIKQMLAWIDENLCREVRVEEIAASANVCVRICQRLFHEYLDCGPIEYFNRKRVLAAAEALIATDDPVINIAMDLGFSSASYFTKQFRRYMGHTPSEHRALAWNRDAESCPGKG